MNKKEYLRFAGFMAIAAMFALAVLKFDIIVTIVMFIIAVLKPIIIGCIMAFVFNIIMVKFEKYYWPKATNAFVKKTRRPFGILFSIVAVLAIIALVLILVIPALADAIGLLAVNAAELYNWIISWIENNKTIMPDLADKLQTIDINWSSVGSKIMEFLKGGISTVFGSTFSIITGTVSFALNLFLAFIFSIYVLSAKEILLDQIKRFIQSYIPHKYEKIAYVYKVSLKSFTAFVVGQFTEAIIIGVLCFAGMSLMRLPYAGVIGVLIGFTALIPIAGAYIGTIIGALLILTVSPWQAIAFVVFLLILQQLEGNLIYPRVVGTSIGLPGLWVFFAVTLGGGVAGIPGMLVGVPLMSIIYELLGTDMKKRLGKKEKVKLKS